MPPCTLYIFSDKHSIAQAILRTHLWSIAFGSVKNRFYFVRRRECHNFFSLGLLKVSILLGNIHMVSNLKGTEG